MLMKDLGWPYENSSTVKREIDKKRKRALFGREVARYHDHYDRRHYAALYRSKQIDFLDGRGWRSTIAIASAPGCRYEAEPNGLCTFDRWNCFGFPLYLSLFLARRVSVFLAFFRFTKGRIMSLDGTSPFKW